MKITRRSGKRTVIVDADTWREVMDWQPIDLDEEGPKDIPKEVYTVMPQEKIQSKDTYPDFKSYYKLDVNTLTITSEPPLSQEVIHLVPCEPKEGELASGNNIYFKNLEDIKQCPFYKAMAKDGVITLEETKTKETYLKYVKGEEVIYFTESFLDKQLLKYRNVDIQRQQDEQGERIDMTMDKLAEGRYNDILKAEKKELEEYLEDKPHKSVGNLHGKVELWHTPYGSLYHIEGTQGDIVDQTVLMMAPDVCPDITLRDGATMPLKDALKNYFAVDLELNPLTHERKQLPPQAEMVFADWYVNQRKQEKALELA